MNFKDYVNIGYGKPEFQKDLHVAIFAMASWAAIRLPQISTFTMAEFQSDLKIMLILGLSKFLASFITNNQPSS
jgi:hypothetical protein